MTFHQRCGFVLFPYLDLFAFGAGWGPIPWLLPAEVFPMSARAKGVALSTSVNWAFNFVVAFITPIAFKNIKAIYYFVILALACLSFLVVWAYYRETAHLSLEEIQIVFADAFDGPRKFIPDFRSRPPMTVAMTYKHTGVLVGKKNVAPITPRAERMLDLPSVDVDAERRGSEIFTDGESSLAAGSSVMGARGYGYGLDLDGVSSEKRRSLASSSMMDAAPGFLDVPLGNGGSEARKSRPE